MFRLTIALVCALFGSMVVLGERSAPVSLQRVESTALNVQPPQATRDYLVLASFVAPAVSPTEPQHVVVVEPTPGVAKTPVTFGNATPQQQAHVSKSDAPTGYSKRFDVTQPKAEGVRASTAGELVKVTGTRVNLRDAPSTNGTVLGKLSRDTHAEVLQRDGNGWAKIRALDSGLVGYMSAKFLQPTS